jgi:hypothetical protein
MSASLYDTFGNEIKYDVLEGILNTFLKNATVKFPLPQASSELLSDAIGAQIDKINGEVLTQIRGRLELIGFSQANSNALSIVLIKVAETLGVNPFTFFDNNANTLKLTKDAYTAINALRPKGNRINLIVPKDNSKSKFSKQFRA